MKRCPTVPVAPRTATRRLRLTASSLTHDAAGYRGLTVGSPSAVAPCAIRASYVTMRPSCVLARVTVTAPCGRTARATSTRASAQETSSVRPQISPQRGRLSLLDYELDDRG